MPKLSVTQDIFTEHKGLNSAQSQQAVPKKEDRSRSHFTLGQANHHGRNGSDSMLNPYSQFQQKQDQMSKTFHQPSNTIS